MIINLRENGTAMTEFLVFVVPLVAKGSSIKIETSSKLSFTAAADHFHLIMFLAPWIALLPISKSLSLSSNRLPRVPGYPLNLTINLSHYTTEMHIVYHNVQILASSPASDPFHNNLLCHCRRTCFQRMHFLFLCPMSGAWERRKPKIISSTSSIRPAHSSSSSSSSFPTPRINQMCSCTRIEHQTHLLTFSSR